MTPLLTVVLVLSMALSQQQPRDAAHAGADTGVIRGRVIAADTRAPVPWAVILLWKPDDSQVTIQVDDRGEFAARNLPTGLYRISALPPANRARFLKTDLSQRIEPKPEESADPVEVVLSVGAAISGRVVDDAGEPLADVLVQPRQRGPDGTVTESFGSRSHETDDQGRFRIFGLPEGEYALSAVSQAWQRTTESPPGFVETFYPSATRVDDAIKIRVKPGQDVEDLEIRLVRTKTFKIAGVVLAPDGQPAGRMTASLTHIGGNGEDLIVDRSGGFVAGGLLPGAYEIMVADSGRNMFGRLRFSIDNAEVTDLVVTSRPGLDIAGRVVVSQEDGSAVPSMKLTSTRTDPDQKMQWMPGDYTVERDGSFVLTRLSGTYIIRPSRTAPGWTLKSVLLNGDDITDKPVEFRSEDSGHLQVVLTRRASSLEGTIKDRQGKIVDDYAVVLFSSNRADWIMESSRMHIAYPRPDSRFRMDAVRPGRYWVVAIPRQRAGGWIFTAKGLDAIVNDATDIVIGDDERRVVELTLVSSPQ
ncbi:MAG TPA: carboxypeptidase-like regulatory domain-containing protein [Vicinamibacterales bacterium]|nr:carboxypeptidase-like regulatory domain-containing protein [Vicinamibacterales bacterium]